MIGTFEIRCHAAKPQMPLPPMFAFKDSPSSLRLLEIPKKIGEWNITTVKVAVNYPDNTTNIYTASRNGNVWVVTFNGCSITGKVANGLEVLADGLDENGEDVNGYVLGVGDIYILDRDTDVEEAVSKHTMRYCDETPETPVGGDVVIENGALKIYDGTQWISVDIDLSEYATKSELETAASTLDSKIDSTKTDLEGSISEVASDIPTKTSELENDSGYITASAIPTNVGAFTNDVGYITASQVKPDPDSRFFGWAEGARQTVMLEGINPQGYPYNQKWAQFGTDGVLSVVEKVYAPWYLSEYNGTTFDPALEMTFGYVKTFTVKIGVRTRTVYVGAYCWRSGRYLIKAEQGETELYYQPTQFGWVNNSGVVEWYETTFNSYMTSIETVGGQSGIITCTRSSFVPAHSIKEVAYTDQIPSSVSQLTNDVGYLTASSTEFKNKRDYDDQTFTMPSDVTLIPFVNGYDYQRWARAYVQKFDVTYDGVEHELNEFIINPEYGMMWYKARTLFMATMDGQTFYLRDNNTNIMATTTISALKSGVVDFTYDGKSGSISMIAREKTNFALDYQTINGNLVVKANGTTVGSYDPQNPIEGVINIPVPSNVSQLNNDAGYLTAQTVASSYYSKTQVDTMLSQKQDVLDEDEITMIGQVTDERKTVITFTDNTSEEYEWSGEITRQNIVDAGLWDVDHGGWIKEPLSIKIGTAVTRLGNYSFANAHQLTSIDIPSTVASIGMYCLYDCSALTGITIPYSMKVIGSDTFGLCSSLTIVTIPNSVESIGAAAFENCTSLSTLLIPDSVTSIGNRAFTGCTNLTNLKIPDNVTSIGDGAFWGSGIQTITIGSSVASIGENAFRDASGVTSAVFRGKTLTQVQSMTNYPWELNTSTISTWNDTSKEYVDGLVGTINTTLDTINGEVI